MTAALTAVFTPYIMAIVSAPGGVDPLGGNGCAIEDRHQASGIRRWEKERKGKVSHWYYMILFNGAFCGITGPGF